jgi:hypothetical protein
MSSSKYFEIHVSPIILVGRMKPLSPRNNSNCVCPQDRVKLDTGELRDVTGDGHDRDLNEIPFHSTTPSALGKIWLGFLTLPWLAMAGMGIWLLIKNGFLRLNLIHLLLSH